jgi:hypothetical protein
MNNRNIRTWISVAEGKIGKIHPDVQAAVPSAFAIPQLTNQDPYMQYRMGIAVASARAVEQGLVKHDDQSAWGENLIMVAQTEEGRRTLELAMKMMGVKGKQLTSPPSEETADVNKSSPVAKFKPTKKSR